MSMSKPEPPPNRNNGETPVWELVIQDIQERDAIGREKYGTPLQPFNGRNSLVDAYQESLDRIVYMRKAIVEQEAMQAELERLRAENATERAEFWKRETGRRVALLAALEWAGSDAIETCPYCGVINNKVSGGKHKALCALARLMTMPEEPKP